MTELGKEENAMQKFLLVILSIFVIMGTLPTGLVNTKWSKGDVKLSIVEMKYVMEEDIKIFQTGRDFTHIMDFKHHKFVRNSLSVLLPLVYLNALTVRARGSPKLTKG